MGVISAQHPGGVVNVAVDHHDDLEVGQGLTRQDIQKHGKAADSPSRRNYYRRVRTVI